MGNSLNSLPVLRGAMCVLVISGTNTLTSKVTCINKLLQCVEGKQLDNYKNN